MSENRSIFEECAAVSERSNRIDRQHYRYDRLLLTNAHHCSFTLGFQRQYAVAYEDVAQQ